MKRIPLLLLLLLAACNKPSDEACRQAISNMRSLMGTDSATANFDTEGDIRRCKGGSTKKAVECAGKATTLDELRACDFMKIPAAKTGSAADTGSAGSAAPDTGSAGSAAPDTGSAGSAAPDTGSAGSAAPDMGSAGSAGSAAAAGSAGSAAGSATAAGSAAATGAGSADSPAAAGSAGSAN